MTYCFMLEMVCQMFLIIFSSRVWCSLNTQSFFLPLRRFVPSCLLQGIKRESGANPEQKQLL